MKILKIAWLILLTIGAGLSWKYSIACVTVLLAGPEGKNVGEFWAMLSSLLISLTAVHLYAIYKLWLKPGWWRVVWQMTEPRSVQKANSYQSE